MRSAVVLAGGRGERFQLPAKPLVDKALIKINGETFLERIVETGLQVANEVVISTNNKKRGESYKEVLKSRGFDGFKICIDETDLPLEGPLLGLKSSLKCCQGPKCLVMPVDVPFMKAEVLELLFKAGKGWDTAIPVWPNGKIEPLIAHYDKEQVFETVQVTYKLGKGRIGDTIRGSSKTLFVHVNEFEKVDPKLESFININRLNDLKANRSARVNGELESSVGIERKKLDFDLIKGVLDGIEKANTENALSLIGKINHKFWKANLLKELADKTRKPDFHVKSGEVFLSESKQYRQRKIFFQELHALIDSDEAFKKAGKSLLDLSNRIDFLFRQIGIIKRRKIRN